MGEDKKLPEVSLSESAESQNKIVAFLEQMI
jgi:hypothetical protein